MLDGLVDSVDSFFQSGDFTGHVQLEQGDRAFLLFSYLEVAAFPILL